MHSYDETVMLVKEMLSFSFNDLCVMESKIRVI